MYAYKSQKSPVAQPARQGRRDPAERAFHGEAGKTVVVIFFLSLISISIDSAWTREGAGIDLSKVSIPKEFGTIKEFYQSPVLGKAPPKIMFHIQDVHANYEAQKNLANILEYLIVTYGLDLILVEGGITDKDFSYIRGWAPLEERRVKAESLLKEGTISGETYVDIATDFPLKFQGIEDKTLYEENMEAYLKVDFIRTDALNLIRNFKDAASKLKNFIYTKRLKDFDAKKDEYKSEALEMVEYLEFLDDTATKEGTRVDRFTNFATFLKTARMEKEIDFNVVEDERDGLLEELTKRLPKESLDELVFKSLNFKEGRIAPGEFYSYLRDISVKNNVGMSRYRNLNTYTDYINTYETLDNKALFNEINKIEDMIADILCKNNEQKTLFMISKNISILEALLLLKLTPEDLEYYRNNKKGFEIKAWKDFLTRQSERFRLNIAIPEDMSVIEENYALFETFYDTAFKRDEAFLKNSLKKMDKEKESIAVFITGGFHTRNMTRIFKASNISYVVITPNVIQKTDEALYDRILKESYKTRIW